ncbi:MAG: hypothetical protein AB2606_07145 [Candidatus Thiodiazotropha taylori]
MFRGLHDLIRKGDEIQLPEKWREIINTMDRNWIALALEEDGFPYLKLFSSQSLTNTDRSAMQHCFHWELEMDSCGLFRLPSTNNPLFDDYTRSESDFIVIGQIEYIEIWEKKVWEEARKRWVIDCFDEDFSNNLNVDNTE